MEKKSWGRIWANEFKECDHNYYSNNYYSSKCWSFIVSQRAPQCPICNNFLFHKFLSDGNNMCCMQDCVKWCTITYLAYLHITQNFYIQIHLLSVQVGWKLLGNLFFQQTSLPHLHKEDSDLFFPLLSVPKKLDSQYLLHRLRHLKTNRKYKLTFMYGHIKILAKSHF